MVYQGVSSSNSLHLSEMKERKEHQRLVQSLQKPYEPPTEKKVDKPLDTSEKEVYTHTIGDKISKGCEQYVKVCYLQRSQYQATI